jgi:heme-degrading monooxygenase HmoA
LTLEVVKWDVKPNQENEFELAFENAQEILSSMNGYKSHQLQKCIEKPNRYILLVEWKTLEDHTIGFRKSDEYQEYRDMIHEYFEPSPLMEHYEMVFENAL